MSIPESQVQLAGWYDDPAGQARFRYWDGSSWTHQTTNAKDPMVGTPALGHGFARLGDWLARFMALAAFASLVVVAVIALAATELGPYGASLAGDPDSPGFVHVDRSDAGHVGIALLLGVTIYLVVSVVTGVIWLFWQYQLAVSAPAQLRRGPGMQVASWFIPVVAYWWPYQNMVDLWSAYGTGRDRQQPEVPSGIGLWWAAYLGLPFLSGLLGSFLLLSADADNALSRVAIFYGGFFASVVVSGLLARGVVVRLSWRALEYCASSQ